jgi:hypothetical protein
MSARLSQVDEEGHHRSRVRRPRSLAEQIVQVLFIGAGGILSLAQVMPNRRVPGPFFCPPVVTPFSLLCHSCMSNVKTLSFPATTSALNGVVW